MNINFCTRPGRQTMQNVRPEQRVPFENLSPLMIMGGNRRSQNDSQRAATVRH